MDIVNIGKFNVDIEGRRIYTSQGEVPVEPKVIDVLFYLMQYSERYVSLQELHAEVWPGRVVTDTAVRRTISKLRALLEDTDPEAPRYIKSQMKRGYQFIYQSEQVEAAIPAVAENNVAEAAVSFVKPELVTVQPGFNKKASPNWYVIGTLLLLFAALIAFLLQKNMQDNQVMRNSPVVDIAGEKRFLSVSEDGRFHTFTGRLSKTGLWQPYLYDFKLGQLQRISIPKDAAYHIVSVVHNDTVAISSFENGQAKLYLHSALDLKAPAKTIQLDELSDIGQALSYQDNLVLINGRKKGENNGLYYLLDLEKITLKQFTYSSLQGSVDFGAALSPDKTHFALIRRDSAHHVQIYRIADKKLVAEESFAQGSVGADEFNLMWLNDHDLLINYADKHKKLNIQTGATTLLPITERFTGFGRDAAGNLFGLLLQPQNKDFYQIQLPDLDTVQRYFSFTETAVSLAHSQEPGKLWLVEQINSGFQLFRFYPATGEKKLSLTQKNPFTVLAESEDYLLLLQQHQLKLLDQNSGDLKNISYENQQVHNAIPALDRHKIIFTEKIGEEWLINVFDRNTNTQSRLLKGYRLLLPWEKQYIAADPQGQFYLLDSSYQQIKQLPMQVNFSQRHQVGVYGDKLIATNLMADSNWALATFDLVTANYQRQLSSSLPMKSDFSFNNDGSIAIVTTENEYTNQLVKIGYNFGYN